MSSTQEYSVYIDSYNKELKLDTDPDNSTNDIVIPINLPCGRLPVVQINLGSLELPLSQYTIENAWNKLYFDEGLDLVVTSESDVSLTQFTIQEGNYIIQGQLPPSLNPVIESSSGGGNTLIFKTLYPHGLDLRNFYNWGEYIRLISTPDDSNVLNIFNSNNTSINIISDYEFSIDYGTTPPTFLTTPIIAYVWSPTIPNPSILAQLVTASLNLIVPDHWSITYSTQTGKFKIKWIGKGCDIRTSNPSILIIPSGNSLPSLMGFGSYNQTIPMPEISEPLTEFDLMLVRERVPDYVETCLISYNCYTCKSYITIDPGNYSATELGSNMNRQWNRFYFSPTAANSLVVTINNDITVTVPIVQGAYTPDTLKEYMETLLNAGAPAGSNFVITWDMTNGVFIFEADVDFALNWDTSAGSQDLAIRLGFLPIVYRSGNYYQSSTPFTVPTKGCCSNTCGENITIPYKMTSYIYMPFLLNSERKYVIERANLPSAEIDTVTYDAPSNTYTITYTVAHGYQPDDVINIATNTTSEYVRVLEVINYNTIIVDAGSSITTPDLTNATFSYLAGNVVGNLYFTQCESDFTMLSRILGFFNSDYLPDPLSTTWKSPSCYSLDYPSYILMEVADPDGSTNNEHTWGNDNKARLFGKIILYPQYRMERSFPIRMLLPDLRTVNRMKFRLLNPDHSLYNLHGKDWSATILFTVIQKSVNLLCY